MMANDKSDEKKKRDKLREFAKKYKEKIYPEYDGRCQLCSHKIDKEVMQMHHILPLERYPELFDRTENLLMVCPECHIEIHLNPFLNSRLMVEAACKMNIDLSKRYKD
jgi:5-methylcytosine-specific restriction endonuclease McrA